jgi:hypothetical protein
MSTKRLPQPTRHEGRSGPEPSSGTAGYADLGLPYPSVRGLAETLLVWTHLYERGGQLPEDQRLPLVFGLVAIQQSLRDMGIGPPALKMLEDLIMALSDADDGIAHPLLAARTKRGRPKASVCRRFLEAQAACAMQVLMDGCMTKKDAASNVASVMVKAGFKLTAGERQRSSTDNTISMWRDSFTGHHGGDPVAKHYDELLGMTRGMSGTADSKSKLHLQVLRRMVSLNLF